MSNHQKGDLSKIDTDDSIESGRRGRDREIGAEVGPRGTVQACKPVDASPGLKNDDSVDKGKDTGATHGSLVAMDDDEFGASNPAHPPAKGDIVAKSDRLRHTFTCEQGGMTMVELADAMKADAATQEHLTTVIAEMLEETVGMPRPSAHLPLYLPLPARRNCHMDPLPCPALPNPPLCRTRPFCHRWVVANTSLPSPLSSSCQVARNDSKGRKGGLFVFEGDKSPITAAAFVRRIMKYAECSPCCLAIGVLYLERLKRRHKTLCLTSYNFQRLFLVAVMGAAKVFDDFYYSNQHWAEVGQCSRTIPPPRALAAVCRASGHSVKVRVALSAFPPTPPSHIQL